MKNNLSLIFWLFAAFLLFSCDKKQNSESTEYIEPKRPDYSLIIKGKVDKKVEFGQIRLFKIDPQNPSGEFLSSKSPDGEGNFEFKVTVLQPSYYVLQFFEEQVVHFVLSKSDINVAAEGVRNGKFELSGCRDSDYFEEFIALKTDIEGKSKTMQAEEHKKYRIEKATEFVNKTKNSIVSLLGLDFFEFKDEAQKKIVAEQLEYLKKTFPGNPFVAKFDSNFNNVKVPEKGDVAPDIDLVSEKGTVKLSSFRGKYVLLDFSKFKDTLLTDNEFLAKAYEKYKPKGFEIITVSMDPLEFDWQWGAFLQNSITWTGVRDMSEEKLESPSAKKYGVNPARTPQTFLINPEGVIISKDVRGKNIFTVLDKIFEEKQP
jgi:peroxiredoxin